MSFDRLVDMKSFDEYKFNAQTMRSLGLAVMTPFAAIAFRLIVDWGEYKFSSFHFMLSLLLLLFGFAVIMRASQIMEDRDRGISRISK